MGKPKMEGAATLIQEIYHLSAAWWTNYKGKKFRFRPFKWVPYIQADDLQKIYDAFVKAHQRNIYAYHQVLLKLVASRDQIAEFEAGALSTVDWDRRAAKPVTFKDYLASKGFDVTVFGS